MHSPSPPQVLLVAEELFHNIKVYFEDSCQNMIFDDHGTLLNPNGADLHNDLCNEFDSYCFTATMFKGRELQLPAALLPVNRTIYVIRSKCGHLASASHTQKRYADHNAGKLR